MNTEDETNTAARKDAKAQITQPRRAKAEGRELEKDEECDPHTGVVFSV
jgi:hypothetical protein